MNKIIIANIIIYLLLLPVCLALPEKSAYAASSVSVEIPVRVEMPADDSKVLLRGEDNTEQIKDLASDGTTSFQLSYSRPGTYYYLASQIEGSENLTYDDSIYRVVVYVTVEGGELYAQVMAYLNSTMEKPDEILFVNKPVTPSDDPTPTPRDDPTPTPGDDPTPTPGDNPTPTPGDNPTPTPGDNPTPPPIDNPIPTPGDNPTPTGVRTGDESVAAFWLLLLISMGVALLFICRRHEQR